MRINKSISLTLFSLAVILLVIYTKTVNITGFVFDVTCFDMWAESIDKYGIAKIYETNADYPPVIYYLFFFNNKLLTLFNFIEDDYLARKVMTLLFSVINSYLIYDILINLLKTKIRKAFAASLLYLMNPAILFNTMIWGQVDEILVTFLLLSFRFLFNKNYLLSSVFFIIAINFKIISLIILPFIIFELVVENFMFPFNKKVVMKSAIILLITLLITLLIYSPFVINHQMYRFFNNLASVGKYPYISYNAYNFWYLVFEDPSKILDSNLCFLKISYKSFGYVVFFFISFIIFLNLFGLRLKMHFLSTKILLASILIVLFTFFLFTTQMHERYSHMIFPFITIYIFAKNGLRVVSFYILFSLSYLVNLINVFQLSYPTIIINKIPLSPQIISCNYILIFAYIIYDTFYINNGNMN